MPTVSIITAAYAPSAEFLPETIASVAAQKMPAGWDIEWVVQEDGAEPFLAEMFAGVSNVSYAANGRQLGIAGTRNLALERASGGLLRVLDSDDLLLPNALESLIPHFLGGSTQWAVGQADDLMTDGSRVSWDPLIPTGPVPAGAVNNYAIEHGGNWPIHCAGLMLRTDMVRALGGWAGTPNDEDIILFSALSEICDGYNDPSVTWLYRQHAGQVTRTASWRAQSAVGRHIALQRVNAVRTLGLISTGTPPVDVAGGERLRVDQPVKDHDSTEYL
ncbi:glycosyltransferase family 2 protein [Winogradskya consettensis]|uniref:Glycosyl transferase n=1 Tax=Winogradskya consettensis TaxID=113560 RepID=A0A919W245_9ACTN|nr:glycosyltransferase family A protein [Actinoplanes consettensis]GIM84799.1 glycosyl transferase [Actinoplanes consettensis]